MNIKNIFTKNFYLTTHTILQAFIAIYVSIGVGPDWLVYASIAIQLLAILFFKLEYALYSVILSLPFSLVIPNPWFDSFSVWRVSIAFLFLVFLVKSKILSVKGLQWKRIEFFSWDKALLVLAIIAGLSVFVAETKGLAVRKLAFLVNAYLLYVVGLNVIHTKDEVMRSIKIGFASLSSIVVVGFFQFFAAFTTSVYYFWQYWATYPARAFYGDQFAETSTYSNSWMSFDAERIPSLRMFSMLPDSHSFAVIAMFALPFALTLALYASNVWQKRLAWLFVVLSSWAIVFSGTRGMWVGGLAVVLGVLALAGIRKKSKILRFSLIPVLLVVLFIAISPLTQQALNSIRASGAYGNFIDRAESIYDLGEQSNTGRLDIWKNSLREVIKRPIIGTGLGNFAVTLRGFLYEEGGNFDELANEPEETFNLPGKYISAHSLYLDFLVELGILGFAAFVWYLVLLVQRFWNYFKAQATSDDPLPFFALVFGIYLIWLFSYSLFDGTLVNDRVLLYYFVGMFLCARIIKYSDHA